MKIPKSLIFNDDDILLLKISVDEFIKLKNLQQLLKTKNKKEFCLC